MKNPMTPTTALLWRQWRETRFALRMAFLVNAVMAITFVPIQLSANWMPAEELAVNGLYIFTLATFCAMIGVLLSHSEKRRITTALNPEIFRMPVGTAKLALLLVGYRVTALLVLVTFSAIALRALAYFPVGAFGDGERVRWAGEIVTAESYTRILLSTLAAYATFQAIEWTLRRFSHTLAWLAILAPPVLINTVVAESWRGHPLVHGITIAVGLPIAVWAVHAERLGLWDRLQRQSTTRGRAAAQRPFRSPVEAQRWFEYRRAGFWLQRSAVIGIALAAGLTLFFLTTQASQAASSEETPVELFLMTAFAYVLLCALVAGIGAAFVRYRDQQTGIATLSFTMPISTQRLARAVFAMTLRTTAIIVAAALFAAGAITAYLQQRPDIDVPVLPATAFLAHALLLAVSVWALYQFGLGMLAAYGLLFFPLLFMLNHDTEFMHLLLGAYPVAIGFIIAAAAWYLLRQRDVAPRHAVTLALSLVILALVCYLMLTVDHSGHTQSIEYSPTIWAAYTLVAAAPLAVTPAYLRWLRTR